MERSYDIRWNDMHSHHVINARYSRHSHAARSSSPQDLEVASSKTSSVAVANSTVGSDNTIRHNNGERNALSMHVGSGWSQVKCVMQ